MKKYKLIRYIVSICIYIFGIIFGYAVGITFDPYMPYINMQSYGGDAYTGIQNACAQASNNIANLSNQISCFGLWIAVISSIIFIVLILKNIENIISVMKEIKDENSNASTNVKNNNHNIQSINAKKQYSEDTVEKMIKYKKYLDDGIMTQEEYEAKKKDLLNL